MRTASSPAATACRAVPYPIPVPRHVTRFCLAVRNRANGFYANHHTGGLDWFNNTAYRNGVNYNMLCNLDAQSSTNDVPGFDHVMKNNLGYSRQRRRSPISARRTTRRFNYFTLTVTVATNDFMTLDESLLHAPRQANGDLPYIAFARLTNTSDCLNAGTNLGFAFYAAAPDLGAFEFGPTNAPSPTVALAGTNLVFSHRRLGEPDELSDRLDRSYAPAVAVDLRRNERVRPVRQLLVHQRHPRRRAATVLSTQTAVTAKSRSERKE